MGSNRWLGEDRHMSDIDEGDRDGDTAHRGNTCDNFCCRSLCNKLKGHTGECRCGSALPGHELPGQILPEQPKTHKAGEVVQVYATISIRRGAGDNAERVTTGYFLDAGCATQHLKASSNRDRPGCLDMAQVVKCVDGHYRLVAGVVDVDNRKIDAAKAARDAALAKLTREDREALGIKP